MGRGVCLSVCLSVCPVPQHNSRTDSPRKPKFGTVETQHTSNPWTYLEVKRSKVKVTRRINAHTVYAQYISNGKAYETWCTDGTRRPVSMSSAMTAKVKGQGRNVTWCVWQALADKSRTKRPRNTKIGRKVVHVPMGDNAHQFQGQRQRSRSPGRYNVKTGPTPMRMGRSIIM